MNAEADLCRSADATEAAAMADLYAAVGSGFAFGAGLRSHHVHGATLLVAPRLPVPIFNRVIGLGTFTPATDADVDAIVATYRAAGLTQFWISVSAVAEPPALAQMLESRGFVPPARRSWVQMHWPANRPPDEAAAAPSLEIRLAHADEHQPLGATIAAAFEMPSALAHWFATLAQRTGWHAFVALDRGNREVAGAAFLYVRGEAAWLGMGAVSPRWRGRGGQLALLAARVRLAQSLGCRRIHTETGEPIGTERNPSLDNLRRCGFQRIASRLNYACAL